MTCSLLRTCCGVPSAIFCPKSRTQILVGHLHDQLEIVLDQHDGHAGAA
jgi:hypothetical protein